MSTATLARNPGAAPPTDTASRNRSVEGPLPHDHGHAAPSIAVQPANILLVDDDPLIIQVMSRALRGLGRLRFATCGREGVRLAMQDPPDILVLDSEMPDLNGFEVWRSLREDPRFENVQLMFVTGHCSEDMEEAGLALGAADFIAKPVRPAILVARVKTHLRLKAALDGLHRLATTDGLTQCANRRVLQERLSLEWSRSIRNRHAMSLLMIDIDLFKQFNDRYGHVAGDHALVEVAGVLKESASRPNDLVARFGGEEFVILLPDTPLEGAKVIADGIQRRLADRALGHEDSPKGRITVSIGIASYRPEAGSSTGGQLTARTDPEAMRSIIGTADRALYAAKHAGRDRSHCAPIDRTTSPLAFGIEGPCSVQQDATVHEG